MFLAKVVGNVVCSEKQTGIVGYKFMLIKEFNPSTQKCENKFKVAVDTVSAGVGDLVMVVKGSSARMSLGRDVGIDLAIIGIVDEVSLDGSQ